MAKIKTREPSPERPKEDGQTLFEQAQDAALSALDSLKDRVFPAPASVPTPDAPPRSALPVSEAPDIVVPPRREARPAAPATLAPAPSPEKKPENVPLSPLQQSLSYIKNMPHSAVIALASMTVSAWLFSQPREDDGFITKSLRMLLRWGGAGVLGTWAWQKYGSELMASQKQEKERPATRPSQRAGAASPEAPGRSGIEVERLPSGACLLWVDDAAYQMSKNYAKLTSIVQQGDVYVLSGSALAIPGKAYFPAAELERIGQLLRSQPGTSLENQEVVGTIKKTDFPLDTWEAIFPLLQKDARNSKISETPEEWKVHTSLSFTFIPPKQ